MHIIKSSALLLIATLLFVSCTTNPPRYGTWFNDTRFEVGLEILPEWYVYSDDNWKNMESWNNGLYYDTTFCHVQKNILFNADTILWEEDVYHSGNVYKTVDCDRQCETLVRRYHFDTREWECELTTASGESAGFTIMTTKTISREDALSLLIDWSMAHSFEPQYELCDFSTGNLIFVIPDPKSNDSPNHVVITECTDSGVYIFNARPGHPVKREPIEPFCVSIYTDTNIAYLNYVRFYALDCQFDTKFLKQQLYSSIGDTLDCCALVRRCYRGPQGQILFTEENPNNLIHCPLLWGPFRIE